MVEDFKHILNYFHTHPHSYWQKLMDIKPELRGAEMIPERFLGDAPKEPESIEGVVNDLSAIAANSIPVMDQNYMGHMTCRLPNFAPSLEAFIARLNQNLVKVETAWSATAVEEQLLSWMYQLVYGCRPEFSARIGNVTGGGTLGNMTALTVARNHALPEISSRGLDAALRRHAYRRAVIVTTERAHYSIKKIAAALGIGSDNVHSVPVEPRSGKVYLSELNRALEELRREKVCVVAIVAVGGATETGSVDDLIRIHEIAKSHGVWLHVDAAWGGGLLFSENEAQALTGIEHADSVVIDAHKMLYVTVTLGMVLFKNPASLKLLEHHASYILREGSSDLGSMSLEGSRNFASLKLWATWKLLGSSGLGYLVDRACNLARRFAKIIEDDANFELTTDPQAAILTYRFNPRRLSLSEAMVDWVNQAIQSTLLRDKKSFVSRTAFRLGSDTHKSAVLRLLTINPLLTEPIFHQALIEQAEIGFDVIDSAGLLY